MEDKTLLKVSLICSILGILILIFISHKIEIPITDIREINKDQLDQKIKVRGEISSITSLDDITILTIDDSTGEIKTVLFDKIDLKQNTVVEISGTIEEYKGEIEIIIDDIKKWS